MRDKLRKIVEAYAELEQSLQTNIVLIRRVCSRGKKRLIRRIWLLTPTNYITALIDIEAAKELLGTYF